MDTDNLKIKDWGERVIYYTQIGEGVLLPNPPRARARNRSRNRNFGTVNKTIDDDYEHEHRCAEHENTYSR